MQIIRSALRFATRFRAQRAGITVERGVYLSARGKYRINPGAQVILCENANLFHDHHLEIEDGAQVYIGEGVHFDEGLRLSATAGARIHIGRSCWFNHDVSIIARQEIIIGDNCIFGPSCYLIDHDHNIVKGKNIMDQGFNSSHLHVGSDVWLGVGATLLMGARIGDGAVIAARAVVTKPVPANEIWGGIPAKRIGLRGEAQ